MATREGPQRRVARLTGELYTFILKDRNITHEELGREMGLSRQRIHQMLADPSASKIYGMRRDQQVYAMDEAIDRITARRGGLAAATKSNVVGTTILRDYMSELETERLMRHGPGLTEKLA